MLTDIPRHRTLLSNLLKEIVTHSELQGRLGFKGGTALFLLDGLPRFSTDLDFDLMDSNEAAPSLQQVDRIVKEIVKDFGEIRDEQIKQDTILNVISYDDQERNIKVEINRRDFGSTYEIRDWLNLSLYVMVREDQFAHKLVCLTDRNQLAGRDLFDVAFMFKQRWEINEAIVEKRVGETLEDYLTDEVLPLIQDASSELIMRDVGELIQDQPESQRWVKNELLDDLEFFVRSYLEGRS